MSRSPTKECAGFHAPGAAACGTGCMDRSPTQVHASFVWEHLALLLAG